MQGKRVNRGDSYLLILIKMKTQPFLAAFSLRYGPISYCKEAAAENAGRTHNVPVDFFLASIHWDFQ